MELYRMFVGSLAQGERYQMELLELVTQSADG